MKLTATLDKNLSEQVAEISAKTGVTCEHVLQDAMNLYISLSRLVNGAHSLAIIDDKTGVKTLINDWILQMPANVIEFNRKNDDKSRQKLC